MVFTREERGHKLITWCTLGGEGARLVIVTYNYYLKNENFKLYIICTKTGCWLSWST